MSALWVFPIAYFAVGSFLATLIWPSGRGFPILVRVGALLPFLFLWPVRVILAQRDGEGNCMCPNCVAKQERGQ